MIANDFILQTSFVPAGLELIWGFNPALKCRAILIASLRDFAASIPREKKLRPKQKNIKDFPIIGLQRVCGSS
jgi:hypothetical protein